MKNDAKNDAYWRAKLSALKHDIESIDEESAEGRRAVELDQSRVGRLSRMDALQSQAMSNAIAGRRRQALTKIDAAFRRIDDGEFGYCIKCGDEIAEKRLELDPAVTTCTDCSR